MSWDGPSSPIELRVPLGTPPSPSPSQNPFPHFGWCQPLPAISSSHLRPRLKPTVKSRILQTCLQSLYNLPPVEMLKTNLPPLELAPDVVVTAPLLGWWFRVLGHMGECGEQSREPQAHLLFSPASRRLALTLEKPWIFGLSPLKWGSGLHANSVP